MSKPEPRWLTTRGLLILHKEGLDEHGGLDGTRDEGLFESAMARPQNLFHYEGVTDLTRLAACYAFGLAKNHPFNDGNKRAAFLAAALFLRKNGFALTATQANATHVVVQLAAGEISEKLFADWLKQNSEPIKD